MQCSKYNGNDTTVGVEMSNRDGLHHVRSLTVYRNTHLHKNSFCLNSRAIHKDDRTIVRASVHLQTDHTPVVHRSRSERSRRRAHLQTDHTSVVDRSRSERWRRCASWMVQNPGVWCYTWRHPTFWKRLCAPHCPSQCRKAVKIVSMRTSMRTTVQIQRQVEIWRLSIISNVRL